MDELMHRGVAQLVARLVRVQEAVGSTPATPTKHRERFSFAVFLFRNHTFARKQL